MEQLGGKACNIPIHVAGAAAGGTFITLPSKLKVDGAPLPVSQKRSGIRREVERKQGGS